MLIPGLGAHHRSWLDFRHCLLAWDHETPDLPGTDDAPAPWTMRETMERLREDLLRRRTPPFHLLGHSLGGMLALEWLEHHPEEVLSVTAINASSAMRFGGPVGRVRLRTWLKVLPELLSSDEPNIETIVDLLVLSEDPVRRRWFIEQYESGALGAPPRANTLLRQFAAAFGWRPDIGKVESTKALLVVGARDEFVPPEASERLHQQLPSSRLVAIDGGHDLMRTHGADLAALVEQHARSLQP